MKDKKVIKGLEYCIGYDDNYCDVCPYSLNEFECDREMLKADALALLKAQEPRVLRLEELFSLSEEPVWLEPKSGKSYTGWVLLDSVRDGTGKADTKLRLTRPVRVMVCPNIDLYGIKWRCWTSRPSDEVRRATPWE